MRYRHLRRTVIAALAAVLFLLLFGLGARLILGSAPVRGWAAKRIERQALARGIGLRIGDLDWGFLPPSVEIDDLSLAAAGVRAEVEHLSVDLLRLRLTSKTVDLGTVEMVGVKVRVNAAATKPRRSRGRDSGLRFTVRHLDLQRIDFEGIGLPGATSVSLRGLSGAWTAQGDRPRGFVIVDKIDLGVPGLSTITIACKARFELADGINVPRWSLNGRGVDLVGGGYLGTSGELRQHFEGAIDLAELDRTVRAGEILDGTLRISATLDTTAEKMLSAEISSPRLSASGFEVKHFSADLDLVDGRLEGSVTNGQLLGGRLRGRYSLGRLASPFPHSVRGELDGANLEQVLTALGIPAAGLAGRARIATELQWSSVRFKEGRGFATAAFEPVPGVLPVAGLLEVELAPPGLLHFSAKGLDIGGSTVQWQGPLTIGSWEPAWSVRADPAVVEEWIPAVNAWVGSTVLPTEVSGLGLLDVTLSGPWKRLRVGARLDAHSLTYPPIVLDRVVAEGSISEAGLRLGPARFRIGQGNGELDGTISWAAEHASTTLDLDLRCQQVAVSDVAAWVGVEDGVTGVASLVGGLRGSIDSPRGSWALGLAGVTVGSQVLGDGSATVALEDGDFLVQGLRFGGGLEGRVQWAVADAEVSGELRWPGMPLERFGEVAGRLLGSSADLDLDFDWPRDGPVLGTVDLRADGAAAVVTADDKGMTVDATIDGSVATVVHLDRVAAGGLEGHGELRLLSAGGLAERLQPGAEIAIAGQAYAPFDVHWPAGEWPRIQGRLEELELALDGRELRLDEPASFSVDDDGLVIEGVHLRVADDEVWAHVAVGGGGSLAGNVAGTIDARVLRALMPEWEPGGRATGVVELLGSLHEPRFEGIAELSGASFRIPESRSVISGINGTVLLSPGEAVLEGVDFRFMSGIGRCSGRVAASDGAVELTLNGTVDELAYPLFSGLGARVSGSWRLQGPVDDLHLSGDLVVTRAQLRRRDDVAAILLDWIEESSGPGAAGGPTFDIHVEADSTIEARGPFLNVLGSASLDLSGTPDELGMAGKIEFQEGGDLSFQGVRYELERCTITFTDPARVDPLVDFQARAWVQNYQITVHLSGSFDHLVPSVSSDPPLEEAGIYSLLALGFQNEAVGGGAMGVGLASSMLTRQINAALDERARMILPVDQVRIDPVLEAATGNPAARVTLVKQLNPKWVVILQSNLSNERQEVIISRWFLARGLFIEASRDLDGTLAVDLKLRRQY